MRHKVHLILESSNSKTGPIPVSTTGAASCPKSCGMYSTCYGKSGPIALHWAHVTAGDRGMTWHQFCKMIAALPEGQLWRHNQVGDLPGDGEIIDERALLELIAANSGKRGFTYTHYPLTKHNVRLIEMANTLGFTINISCDSMEHLKVVQQLGIDAPAVVIMPSDAKKKSTEGVLTCPATYKKGVTCQNCGLCASAAVTRPVIGFPAHGAWKRKIDVHLKQRNFF